MDSKEIKFLRENVFNKKNDIFSVANMFELLDETIGELGSTLFFETESREYTKKTRAATPTAKITEAWGKRGNKDREIIQRFTANLGGEATTVEDKIKLIQAVINPPSGAADAVTIGQILTVMMVVEIMSSILEEFTQAAGGFIFEGFLAGLFGGQSIQITDPKDLGPQAPGRVAGTGDEGASAVAGKPITDVLLGGKHYSLKLLGPDTAVKGSFSNMIQHFIDYDHVIYLDARRDGTKLKFSEFDITIEEFLDVFFRPWAKIKQLTKRYSTPQSLIKALDSYGGKAWFVQFNRQPLTANALAQHVGKKSGKRGFDVGSEELNALLGLDPKLLKPFGPFTIKYSEERFGGSKLKKLFGSGRQFNDVQFAIEGLKNGTVPREEVIAKLLALPGAGATGKPEQFVFTPDQTRSIKSHRDIGVLELGEPALKKIWLAHGNLVNSTMAPVYEALNKFTDDVNDFFLGRENRKEKGQMAIKDADDLEKATTSAVKEVGGDAADIAADAGSSMSKQATAALNRSRRRHMQKYSPGGRGGGAQSLEEVSITDETLGLNTEKE